MAIIIVTDPVAVDKRERESASAAYYCSVGVPEEASVLYCAEGSSGLEHGMTVFREVSCSLIRVLILVYIWKGGNFLHVLSYNVANNTAYGIQDPYLNTFSLLKTDAEILGHLTTTQVKIVVLIRSTDQMPSLTMKAQSSTGCLKEKNGLRVCQKSHMISKQACSYAKRSEHTTDFNSCKCQAVSSSTQVSTGENGSGEAIHEFDEEDSKILIQSCDSPTKRAEPFPACPSNMETIFSPSFDPIEVRSEANSEPNAESDAGLGAGDSDDNRISCDDHNCDVSDFYISDMIISSLPFGGDAFADDICETNCFPDYKYAEPNILFDVSEQYMLLPFPEDTVRNSNSNNLDDKLYQEAVMDTDRAGLYLEIGQMRPCLQDTVINSSDSDQAECFDPQLFMKNLPELSDVVSNFQTNLLPEEASKRKSVTLVLDLDETLVHSTLEHCDDSDFTFTVFFNMKEHMVYVKRRPHLQTFLERVAEMFEVVVFTASQSIYAEQLLDILDPYRKFISRRVYRESCIFTDGSYTKDLTVLGVDLAKVAIIDNTPQVFRLQVNNGIPIKSWFDDPSDSALISLLPFLETLVNADDVRPIIAKRFGNKE
ncbi:hypothetical protein ACLB2K_024050 [Fragaria x ananassa]